MLIKPTVGRSLHFFLANTRSGFAGSPGTPLACIIAAVLDDRHVNLAVFDANGTAHAVHNVPLHHDDESQPAGEFCRWMPFQVGQAQAAHAQANQAPTELPPPVDNAHVAPGAEQFTGGALPMAGGAGNANSTGKAEDDPAHPAGSGGPMDPANTAAGNMSAEQKKEGQDGGRPTTGGLTPKDASLPAPAAEKAKADAEAEKKLDKKLDKKK